MARRPREALRFTRVKLTNWRNFREAEVRLTQRAFLIGPNASGKSNFLDALRFLHDLAKPNGGGLSTAVDDRDGLSKLRCLHARNPSYIELDVDIGNDSNPIAWGYRLRFSKVGKENFVTALEEEIRRDGSVLGETRTRPKSTDDPLTYSQTRIQQVEQNKDFREIVTFFASIRYPHIVPQVIRNQARARPLAEDFFGGDLLLQIKETAPRIREARLRRISGALKIAVPQFVALEHKDDIEGHPHLYASYQNWRFPAARQSEEMFSDGTLRLIGFLWAIAEGGGPLLLEEPELSLHEAVVAQLPILIATAQRNSGRQVIATTHSGPLVDASGVGMYEVHRLRVGPNGTKIETTADVAEIRVLVDQNWSISEATLPLTKPKDIEQLSLFDVTSD